MQALKYLVHYKNYSTDNSHKTGQMLNVAWLVKTV